MQYRADTAFWLCTAVFIKTVILSHVLILHNQILDKRTLWQPTL